ncbi:MAG: hypothetical protein QGH53_05000, partial [Prochlorococcaceae cyanobacterium ETNP18_MAG_1]|nr:hypothetical protein [Prochlorococcaceae cyanobacterium ETNP18_MAG_1]
NRNIKDFQRALNQPSLQTSRNWRESRLMPCDQLSRGYISPLDDFIELIQLSLERIARLSPCEDWPLQDQEHKPLLFSLQAKRQKRVTSQSQSLQTMAESITASVSDRD